MKTSKKQIEITGLGFKSAFKVTLGIIAGQVVATLIGLVTIGVILGALYLVGSWLI